MEKEWKFDDGLPEISDYQSSLRVVESCPDWYQPLIRSSSLWIFRISIVSLQALKKSSPAAICALLSFCVYRMTTEKDFKLFLNKVVFDDHDLIHKAIGWTLREVGKQSKSLLLKFLEAHKSLLHKTTISYATERLSPAEKKKFKT